VLCALSTQNALTACRLTSPQEGAPFKDGWKEFLSSLSWTSYLFVAVAVVDVCLVWAYCGWSVNRPGGAIEESLHIALALAVSMLEAGLGACCTQPPQTDAACRINANAGIL